MLTDDEIVQAILSGSQEKEEGERISKGEGRKAAVSNIIHLTTKELIVVDVMFIKKMM